MSIAGHLRRRMVEHYSHIRMAAKRAALDAIAVVPKQPTLEAVVHRNCNQVAEGQNIAVAKSLNQLVGLGRVELPTSPLSVVNCDCITVCDNLPQPAIYAALLNVRWCDGLRPMTAVLDCDPYQKPYQISPP
jgi:hypothetical protein